MKLQLTISLLVSDRMDTLRKCLDSITPLLRDLESELIIVFTGKEPAVLGTARQYTSHIIPFTWCDDFSKARNTGLKEAKGEWFLYLDDDEWFEDVTEIIQFFKSGEYHYYQSAMYIQRNYDDLEGRTYNDSHVGRMCRLEPDTEFISPIHEYLYPFSDPCKYFQCFVHHFGYARKGTSADIRKRFERNSALLLKAYRENPTAHNCMQLAQEYRYIDDEATAIKYCREGLRLAAKEKRIHTYELWMQVHLPLMLSVIGNQDGALKEGERILRSPRLLEVGQAHIHSILATLCWDMKEYKKGFQHVLGLRKTMLYLEKHPDKAMRQTGASITYATAKEHETPAYIAGLLFSAELKDNRQLKEILSWIPWNEDKLIQNHYRNLEQIKIRYPEQREAILEGYFYLQTDNSYVNLQKALYAEEKHMSIDLEKLFRSCAQNYPSGFMHQIIEMAKRNQFSLNPLLKQISIETWDEYIKTLEMNPNVSNISEHLQEFQKPLANYPICYRRVEQHFLEQQLIKENTEINQLLKLFAQYSQSLLEEADTLYKKEIFTAPISYVIPYKYKFAFMIEGILNNLESKNYKECSRLFEESVHIYPQMSVPLHRLYKYSEEKKNKQNSKF